METSEYWNNFKNKKVRLIIKDGMKVRPRDGIFKGIDDTHVFLEVKEGEPPKPFSRNDIKRIELTK